MLAPAGMLGAAAGTAAAGSPGPGPTGPPTNVSTYNVGDEEFPFDGIQWTNGDVTAQTAVGFSTSAGTDPTSNFATRSPGDTSYETGSCTSPRYWWVRHQKNAQFSAWVTGGIGFGPCG